MAKHYSLMSLQAYVVRKGMAVFFQLDIGQAPAAVMQAHASSIVYRPTHV